MTHRCPRCNSRLYLQLKSANELMAKGTKKSAGEKKRKINYGRAKELRTKGLTLKMIAETLGASREGVRAALIKMDMLPRGLSLNEQES